MAKATKTATKGKKAASTAKSKKSSKSATSGRREWTEADMKALKTLVKQNTPTRLIAMKLDRSETSVRGKAQREGISLAPTNRSPRD